MDVIMQEYRTMPAGSPDYSLGSRRTIMQPGGQFNDAGRLGNMGLRQVQATQAPAGTSPITPGMPSATSPFGAAPTPLSAPTMPSPELQRAAFERMLQNENIPVTAPATMANVPPASRMLGGQTRGVREPGFFERLFQGTDFQSNNMPVTMTLPSTAANPPQYINYGNPNSAADFFRADRALMQQNPAMFGLLGGTNG
jgi:hypothetical protein